MSLKDEIEKLILAEQQELERRDRKEADYYQRQRQRFVPLRAVLEEISKSVVPAYLQSEIGEYTATLEVGRKKGQHFSAEVRWCIEPNYEHGWDAEKRDFRWNEAAGFRVEETNCYQLPDPEYNIDECTRTFDSEEAVAE